MKNFIEKILNIYPSERGNFLMATFLFFSVFFFVAIFRNYVDTSFIKRYGPENIPLMLLINGGLSFAFFDICRRLDYRISDTTMLAGFLFLFALAQAGVFLLIKIEIDLAYPIIFQMLYLLDAFLLVYLWNLIQSLFDARQGKRLFRLFMAAQVLGNIVGSLTVRPLAQLVGFDQVLMVCAGANLMLAVILTWNNRLQPAGAQIRREKPKTNPAIVMAAVGKYPIFRFLCVCALLPSLLLPILTYQFGIVAASTFTSEHSLMTFLGWFRAGTTLFAFVFIVVMGSFYAKLSPRSAAMVPPLNFCLVCGALTGFFNIITLAYGQFSFIVLQRAILGPVTKQLFTLLPKGISSWAQLFVRGILTQTGMLIGALLMLALRPYLSPQEMGGVGLGLALLWCREAWIFRDKYRVGLKQIMIHNGLDFDLFSEVSTGQVEAGGTAQASKDLEAYPEDVLTLMEDLDIPAMSPDEAMMQLDSPDNRTRAAAASTFALTRDYRAVNKLIELLADAEPARGAAVEALAHYGPGLVPILEQTLPESPANVRRGILEILRSGRCGEADIKPFLGLLLLDVYRGLIAARTLENLPATITRVLLTTHLREKGQEDLGLVFLTLWITHPDMRLALWAIETRAASAAVEMLEVSLDPVLAAWIVPLVDSIPEEETINRGRQVFPMIGESAPERILTALSGHHDPVNRLLSLCVMGESSTGPEFFPTAQRRLDDTQTDVRLAAGYCLKRCLNQEADMPAIINLVQQLRGFPMFSGMGIRELRAVASITEITSYPSGSLIIRHGQDVVGIHLVSSGRVLKRNNQGEVTSQIGPGDFFGELDLFSPQLPDHDYSAMDNVEALLIRSAHFMEIIKLYPLISLNLCRYFAGKLKELESATLPAINHYPKSSQPVPG